MGEDKRFIDFDARLSNREQLTQILDAAFAEKTISDWMDIFAGKIPIGPVYDLDQALDNPFVKERGMIQKYNHPKKGNLRVLSNPIQDNGERLPVSRAPLLGEQNEEILSELGYSANEIEALSKDDVI